MLTLAKPQTDCRARVKRCCNNPNQHDSREKGSDFMLFWSFNGRARKNSPTNGGHLVVNKDQRTGENRLTPGWAQWAGGRLAGKMLFSEILILQSHALCSKANN